MLKHRRRLMPVTRHMIFHPIYCTSKDTVGLDVFLQRRLLICGLHRFLLLYFMLIHCRWLMLVPRQMIFDPIHGTTNDSIMPDVVFERRLLIRRLDCPLFLCGVFQHCRRLVLVPRHVILDPIHGAGDESVVLHIFTPGGLLVGNLGCWRLHVSCNVVIHCRGLVLMTGQVILDPVHCTTNDTIMLDVFSKRRFLISDLHCLFCCCGGNRLITGSSY
mmetsp:Transcript_46378/g.87055  ORF Transcript_46378/g.87055 Transcript_46378/m.87055 type:complete len:217 (+) Transcript_46378:445-1095(+)